MATTDISFAARARAMMTDTGPFQAVWAFEEHEHRDLVRGINRVHEVACDIGSHPVAHLAVDLLEVLGWLDRTLEPHIAWEESWLYPEIDALLGTSWATRAACFDHRQIREMGARLRADQALLSSRRSGERQADVRCHLFGLEALLRAHVEREERFLIPLLVDGGSSPGVRSPTPPTHASG